MVNNQKEYFMNRKNFARTTVAAAVFAALAGSYLIQEPFHLNQAMAAPAPETVPPVARSIAAGIGSPADFSGIVERYGPAVVNISVTGKTEQMNRLPAASEINPNDPFYEFFQHFGSQLPREPQGGAIPHGLGSGFIVDSNGRILTNAHVVDNAQEVIVKLTDRREFKAKVLGTDRQSDVAIIKIDAKNLPTVVIGDPALTKVGEPVLAIGSPFGFENTATAGIVSAKSRSLPDDPYVSFMQTDVAVNPGNSGGPLFNLKGEVIGINAQIYTRTGGYQGLSFAIPIDVANKVQAQLVRYGKVTRGRLGVTIQEIDQALANSFGLQKPEGALVSSVEKDSPAEKAGIEPGDVIVSLNGRAISHSSDLSSQVSDLAPGSVGKLDIIRKGNPMTLTVDVGEMKTASLAQNDDVSANKGRLGVLVRPLAKEEQLAGAPNGLLVEQASGPAARAGIQSGDVILSLNGTPISSERQFKALVQKAGHNLALLIQRDDAKIFIPVDLG
jgi:serine protease Do